MDDKEILRQLKAGDLSACRACVEAHSDGLYRLAYRMLHNEMAAEDVVQDTFLGAFRALDQFEGRSTLGTWLYRIAYNNALMHRRAQPPLQSLSEHESDHAGPSAAKEPGGHESPDVVVARKEASALLEQAIESLPPSLRTVFQLREIEERSTAETAEIMSLSEAAVKVRLHRARGLLRGKLSSYFGEAVAPGALLDRTTPRVIPAPDREELLGGIRAAFAARRSQPQQKKNG